jgi:hypothetical protein
MNILDPIFYRTLFYDFRQWTPQEKPAGKSTLSSPSQQVLEGLFTNNQLKT